MCNRSFWIGRCVGIFLASPLTLLDLTDIGTSASCYATVGTTLWILKVTDPSHQQQGVIFPSEEWLKIVTPASQDIVAVYWSTNKPALALTNRFQRFARINSLFGLLVCLRCVVVN